MRPTRKAITQSGYHSLKAQGWRKAVPAHFYELHPLRIFTKCHTWDAMEIRFLLHTAGIRCNQSGVFLQHHHVQISHRVDHSNAARYFPDDMAIA